MFDVLISLNDPFFTQDFVSSKTVSLLEDANVIYIPLSLDGFSALFHVNTSDSTLDNARRLLDNLSHFFDPAVFQNNTTFAAQLADILKDMHSDILVNTDKIAADMGPGGPLFAYFFKSRATQYAVFEQQCFQDTLEFAMYEQTHDAGACAFCSAQPEVSEAECDAFRADAIAGSSQPQLLYELASQLKGMITLYEEEYGGASSFYDALTPADSISIQSRLFVPSADGSSNHLNIVIKFHILKPRYGF